MIDAYFTLQYRKAILAVFLYLLYRLERTHRGLQGNPCSDACSTSSPPPSPIVFCRTVPLTFFLTPLCLCGVSPFLKHVFPGVPPPWLRGWVGPVAGLLRDRPEPALTGTGPPRPLLTGAAPQPPAPNTSPRAPSAP